MQQPNQDQQDDANGGGGSRPSSPFPDQLQNRNYGRRIVRASSAVGAASASSSAMAFPTRRRVHAVAAAASPASAGGTSRGDARAIIESNDPRQEDVNTAKTSDSVDPNVQDDSGTATNSNSSSHEEGSRRSSLEIAMEAAAAPKLLLRAEEQDQQQQEYHQQDRHRPSHYNNDDPHTSHDYLVPLKGGGSDHGPDPTTIEDDDEAHPAPSPRSTSKRTLALHQQPRRSMRVPPSNSRTSSHRPAAAQRSNSFVSLGSSIGSIGSYIEDRLGDMMDGSISILNRENSATAAGRRGGRKNMLRSGEASQDETGGLLDSSDGNIIDGHHHPHNNSSSQSLDLHSIDEVVVVDADDDPHRRSKKRSSMHSETSMLTDDDLEDHLHSSARRKRVHGGHRSSSGGADIHDRIDRLERMLQEQRRDSDTGAVGDGAARHRSFRSFLSVDLGFGSVEKRGQGHHCRWYALMAVGVATVLGLTFRWGMYEGSHSSSISNADSNGWRPSQSFDDEDDLSRFIPKVSLALENALDAAKAKAKKGENQGKNSDLFFSETTDEEEEEPENDDSDDKRNLELMVQCASPSGCLEVIKLADVVKLDESIRSNMVSIALSPDKFDDLRAIPDIRTIDLDYKIEGVEDEIVEAHIDLMEMEKRQNSSTTDLDGNLRGRRRTVQSIPLGFEMIQAVSPDGTPFRAGPHERRICIADTGTCKGHPDLYRGFPSQFDGQDLHMFGSQSFKWDADKHSHGCHMHGILQATHNHIGIQGAGGSNVFITRALNERKEGSISQMMAAIDQCVDAGAHIILLSLGCFNCEQAMNENFFRKIHRKGIVTIAAAGNNGHLDEAPPMIPAAFPTSTISVGAVNLQKTRHYMSAVNSQVEFCANGVDIISTGFDLVGGRYYWDYVKKTGSSMAAPQVAAVVSLLWSHFPVCSGDQIRSVLAKTATGPAGPCDDNCGFGIPQLQDAYDLLDSTRPYPGSNDYNCNVAGLILSSTNNVCDCVNSRGDPSQCLDVSSTSSSASKVSQYQQSSSHSSTKTRCADDSSARFKLAVSSRNLQIQVLNRQKNRNNNKKRNRRKATRGCEFVGKASYAQIVKYCRNTKVRQSCKRTCSYAGFEYADCTF